MRPGPLLRCSAAVCVAVAFAVTTATAAPRRASAGNAFEQALLSEINAVRQAHDLTPLRLSPALARAAHVHSAEMARIGFFGHASPDGSPFDRRIGRFYGWKGTRYWSVGENLVAGCPELDVEEAVKTWMDSPPHRRTLLSSEWREIGISEIHDDASPGVYEGQPVTVVTADFGVRR